MRYLFLFVFSLSLLTTAHAEIKIRVLDPQNAAIPGAQVQLLSPEGRVIKETTTSATGEYQFFPVTFGDFVSLYEAAAAKAAR